MAAMGLRVGAGLVLRRAGAVCLGSARELEPPALVPNEPSCYHFRVFDRRGFAIISVTVAAVTTVVVPTFKRRRVVDVALDAAMGRSLPIRALSAHCFVRS